MKVYWARARQNDKPRYRISISVVISGTGVSPLAPVVTFPVVPNWTTKKLPGFVLRESTKMPERKRCAWRKIAMSVIPSPS